MQFLLKFILIVILVIWLLRLLARFLFPWAMRKAAEKVMRDTQHQFRGSPFGGGGHHRASANQRQQQRPPDGKVRIDYVPPKSGERKGPQKAGEFIDFEEVSTN